MLMLLLLLLLLPPPPLQLVVKSSSFLFNRRHRLLYGVKLDGIPYALCQVLHTVRPLVWDVQHITWPVGE
jgi:hypothetical protein